MKSPLKRPTPGRVIDDPRLQSWPPVVQDGKDIRMRFRTLPPFRLFLLYEFLFSPLRALWSLAVGAYIIAIALQKFELYDAFKRSPSSEFWIFVVLVGLAAAWITEKMRIYPASRFLFGRNVSIQISADAVIVRAGFASRKFQQKYNLSFTLHPIAGARTDIYQNSSFFCIVLDDIKRIPLVEIFHSISVEDVITNANVAMRLCREFQKGGHGQPPPSMVQDDDMLM